MGQIVSKTAVRAVERANARDHAAPVADGGDHADLRIGGVQILPPSPSKDVGRLPDLPAPFVGRSQVARGTLVGQCVGGKRRCFRSSPAA